MYKCNTGTFIGGLVCENNCLKVCVNIKQMRNLAVPPRVTAFIYNNHLQQTTLNRFVMCPLEKSFIKTEIFFNIAMQQRNNFCGVLPFKNMYQPTSKAHYALYVHQFTAQLGDCFVPVGY